MWNDSVPLIVDGTTGNQTTFNTPLQALIDRTDYLKQRLDELSNLSNTIQANVVTASDVVVGDLVWYNPTYSRLEKALAVWDTSYDTNGELKVSPRASVAGLVISKSADTIGDLLLEGEYEDEAVVTALLGANPLQGRYWLSNVNAGKAIPTTPPLKVPVLTYEGSNRLVLNLTAVPTPNHIHKSLDLEKGWLLITDPAFTGMDIPGTAVRGYDIASDPDLTELFATYHGEIAVINDGTLLNTDSVVVNGSNIWWMRVDVPQGWFKAYAYLPYLNGEPVLRSASSDTPAELTISAANGHLKANAVPWTTATAQVTTPSAITDITGKVITRTPVITSVTSGIGANVSITSQGKAVVSLDTSMESLIDAQLVDLNNALQFTDDPYILFNFPANRVSSILGKVNVPKMNTGNTYSMSVWAMVKGMTGGTVPTPVTFPSLTVSMIFVPNPGTGTTDLGTLVPVVTSLPDIASVQGNVYFRETPSGLGRITVTSEGTLYIKLSAVSAAGDKVMLRFGAKTYVVS
jgi:hypothetical protein